MLNPTGFGLKNGFDKNNLAELDLKQSLIENDFGLKQL